MSDAPLVLVSNRGPVTYQEDGSVKRGTGGLVTALTGLASHRDAIWIASAMTDQDVDVAREHGGKPFEVEAPEGGSFRIRFVESDDDAYDSFYNIIANPMLWFIQHYLWDLSNAPDIRQHEVDAFEHGYQAVNRDLAEAVIDEIEGQDEPVVMVHDYHLYTLPAMVREARPDVFLHHFVHIPWTQPDAWRVLPTLVARADLPRAAGQRHHRVPHALLPAQLPAVLPRSAGSGGRFRARRGRLRRPRGVGPGVSAADRLRGHARGGAPAARARVRGARAGAAARVRDPARRSRGPVEERPARVHRVRHLPGAAPGVRRADHVHGAADAVADRRARVRRVPGEDRGAGGGRQPPPRHAGLDADRSQAAR